MIKEGGMLSMLKNLVRFLTSSRNALMKENTAMSGIKACEKSSLMLMQFKGISQKPSITLKL